MERHFVSFKKGTGNRNSSVRRMKQSRLMLVSNCVVFDKRKSKFIEEKKIVD